MPRKLVPKKLETYISDFCEEEESESKPKQKENKQSSKAGKRKVTKIEKSKDESDEEGQERGDDFMPVTSMLEQFGSDVQKTIGEKRRKMEAISKHYKTSQEKIGTVLQSQASIRQKLLEEYEKKVAAILSQWEEDVGKAKESEEKINNLFNQQLKLLSQFRAVQNQRFKSIKQLHEQYTKSVLEVAELQGTERKDLADEVDRDMVVLQNKFITNAKKQEMAHMRKTLSMYYQ